jgi:transposase
MSTSLLYHGFGIRGYHYIRTIYQMGCVFFNIVQDSFSLRCPHCKSKNVIKRGTKTRTLRTVPIGNKPVFINIPVQRVECRDCSSIRQVKLNFADERYFYTKAFERYALDLLKHMTILDVAQHLGVSWDVIKEIQKRNLQKRYSKPKLNKLKKIAIDEISIGNGHKYLTIVLDLITGAVVFVGDGKGADALDPFWKLLKPKSAKKIKAVAMDMSPAYISAVSYNLPNATIVFDHFHIIKLYNDKLSDFRRQLHRTMPDDLKKDVLKGTRWLLLKGNENLDDSRNEQKRLQAALELNRPLAIVYYMKEDLRSLWDWDDKETAEWHLDSWREMAKASKIPMLIKFANTLSAHRSGILSYFDHRISTGPLEGTDNKIKTMKRQAYGFRDMDFFKLKIMGIHETKYALVG